jgi:AcrR family transcriptional regulator
VDEVTETQPRVLPAPRALRADAKRNHDTLLVTAARLFAAAGPDVPLEEIARQAGVGIGTLYRHFPTRDALLAAAYRREVESLCGGVEELLASMPPDQALEAWMQRFVRHVAVKRGMAQAIKAAAGQDSELFTYSHALITEALGRLAAAGETAGLIRSDIDPYDLLRAIGGFCSVTDQPGWEERASRLVGLLVDGMRYGSPIAAG